MYSPTEPSKRRFVGGGLLRSITPALSTTGPLRAGDDVSWLPRVRVGDDQGQVGCCAIFAVAGWAEIMFGKTIPDPDRVALYRQTCEDLGQGDVGLTFLDAYCAAFDAGWLPGTHRIEPAMDLSELVNQPVLAGYTVTPAWEHPNAAGCLDHDAETTDLGLHAVSIVGHGVLDSIPAMGRLVYILNSWGLPWGWKGIGVMTEGLHHAMINSLWVIR